MTQNELDQHVKILGWLNVVFGVLYILIGACVFLLLVSIIPLSGDPEAVPVLGVVAIFLGGFMLVMALPGLAAGVGLLKRRNWGRILAIIVGVLNIPNSPWARPSASTRCTSSCRAKRPPTSRARSCERLNCVNSAPAGAQNRPIRRLNQYND